MRQLDLFVQENSLNPESSDPGSWVVSGVITTQQLSHRGGPEQTVVLSDLPPRQAQHASHARKSYNTARPNPATMGSQSKDQKELTVLVTGFGPFREQYPVNPSWEIAKDLPSHLAPLRAKDAGSRDAPETPPVRIIVHPEPIRVNYSVVRDLVPSFWDAAHEGRAIDIAVHIGMAGPRPFYQLERRAHRRGYRSLDVDNELPAEGAEGRPDDEAWIWHGLPDEILTDVDVDDVYNRWRGHSSKDMDLRVSEDPGRYLCDFIYYSSLAHLWKAQRPRKVVFLHVPSDASGEFVARGRELAVNLIRALAESETAAREKALRDEGEPSADKS